MEMKQDERLVIRVTPELKKRIEELAEKQNSTISELVINHQYNEI